MDDADASCEPATEDPSDDAAHTDDELIVESPDARVRLAAEPRERLAFLQHHLGSPWPEVSDEALAAMARYSNGDARSAIGAAASERLDATSPIRTWTLSWPISLSAIHPPTGLISAPGNDLPLFRRVFHPDLRALLHRFFAPECELWPRFRDAPAAKHYHQAYRHGLLEHCLSVAQGVSALSSMPTRAP